MQFAIVTSLTLFRCVAALLVVAVFWPREAWEVVFFIMLTAFITDFVDGLLARRWRVVSSFGKIADPLADKAICLTVLWLVASYYHAWPYVAIAIVITIYDVAITSLRLFTKDNLRPIAAASTIAKLKTSVLMLGLSFAMLGIMADAQGTPFAMLNTAGLVLLVLTCVLSVWSLVYYLRWTFAADKIPKPTTAIERYPSLLDIDFKRWHRQGIRCVLLDVDGTITPWLGSEVLPDIAKKLRDARRQGVINHLALATNAKKKHAERLEKLATQCGADIFFNPARFRERKPRPTLILRAIEHFKVKPDQVAMIGDKLTMDVLAAKRAKIAKVAWVDRLGDADHPLDRLFRRPLEKMLEPRYKK